MIFAKSNKKAFGLVFLTYKVKVLILQYIILKADCLFFINTWALISTSFNIPALNRLTA